MLTYVINTSENKTFDSDLLFELVGYNKIRWMHCNLSEIHLKAQEIYTIQNVVGADAFRIVVLIDFYKFDRIYRPYGDNKPTANIDPGVYRQFLNIYLSQQVFSLFERRNLPAEQNVIYYIQSGKAEQYYDFANRNEQSASVFLRPVLSGGDSADAVSGMESLDFLETIYRDIRVVEGEKVAPHPTTIPEEAYREKAQTPAEKVKALTRELKEKDRACSFFELYCTKETSLRFDTERFGAPVMTFDEFLRAVRDKQAAFGNNRLITHSYPQMREGDAFAAFDNLSLSLYLIHMYEREERIDDAEEITIDNIAYNALKQTLERALSRVHSARTVALENKGNYYRLDLQQGKVKVEDLSDEELRKIVTPDALTEFEKGKKPSPEEQYDEICRYEAHKDLLFNTDSIEKFDRLFQQYLEERDRTSSKEIEAKFEEAKVSNMLQMTDQCPSEMDYRNAILHKHRELEVILSDALKAEYVEIDFTEEKERADKAFLRYKQAKARMTRNVIGDAVFLVFTLLTMLIPYCALQCQKDPFSPVSFTMYGIAAAVFSGIFLFSFFVHFIPVERMIQKSKADLQECYTDCLIKQKAGFYLLRKRYEQELLRVEEIRYELRQITALYEENLRIEECVRMHREMLEAVEDRLSGMLSNMGVHPKISDDESVSEDIALDKPFRAAENRIYKIFSIDSIEAMFDRKPKGVWE